MQQEAEGAKEGCDDAGGKRPRRVRDQDVWEADQKGPSGSKAQSDGLESSQGFCLVENLQTGIMAALQVRTARSPGPG
jgi:hypothetical protein